MPLQARWQNAMLHRRVNASSCGARQMQARLALSVGRMSRVSASRGSRIELRNLRGDLPAAGQARRARVCVFGSLSPATTAVFCPLLFSHWAKGCMPRRGRRWIADTSHWPPCTLLQQVTRWALETGEPAEACERASCCCARTALLIEGGGMRAVATDVISAAQANLPPRCCGFVSNHCLADAQRAHKAARSPSGHPLRRLARGRECRRGKGQGASLIL